MTRLLVLIASLTVACGSVGGALAETSPTQLLQTANANLQTAKTAHIEGTGSFAIKSGMSISFDFKLSGDTELPDKSRMSLQMSLLGQAVSVDTITVGGRTYTKDLNTARWSESTPDDAAQNALLDPRGPADLGGALTVTEIDRPTIDGRKTRHLSYTVDTAKLLERMKQSATSSPFNASNVVGKGEVWIRTDDSQIVRQLVTVSFDMEGDLGLPMGTGAQAPGKATFEMSFDLRFSKLGEPLSPPITAP